MSVLSRSAIHVGAVRGRYFRENFAQGGIDLSQIVPELVTNADAAIAASERERDGSRLLLPRPSRSSWSVGGRRCAPFGCRRCVPGALSAASMMVSGCTPPRSTGAWAHGRAARARRSAAWPVRPGLRDVWLAQGAGRFKACEMGGGWSRLAKRRTTIRAVISPDWSRCDSSGSPGERRGITLLADPEQIPPDTPPIAAFSSATRSC